MLQFVVRRLFGALIVAFGIVSVVFALIHLTPGDPVEVMLGESATAADREQLRTALGLNEPLGRQYGHYLARVARFDLGQSLHVRRPIADLLRERLPATLTLAAAGVAVSLLLALPIGIGAALRRGTWFDRGALAFATTAVSMPGFWLGPLLILVFSLWLGWLPVSGRDEPLAWVLPAVTLGLALAATLSRIVRAALLDVLAEDYLRTARAKGLRGRAVILRHALANAALPVLTVVGLQLGALLGGAVITETVFQWPGLGLLTVEAIQRRDYPTLQACVLVISLAYVLVNTVTDLLYGLVDPRLRLT
jgi:peptide/nickel transport system permease protein